MMASKRPFAHAKLQGTVYPAKRQRLRKGSYQPNRYDNATARAHVAGHAYDPASAQPLELVPVTRNRLHFYAPNVHTVYKPSVQRMSTRLGSKSKMARRAPK